MNLIPSKLEGAAAYWISHQLQIFGGGGDGGRQKMNDDGRCHDEERMLL